MTITERLVFGFATVMSVAAVLAIAWGATFARGVCNTAAPAPHMTMRQYLVQQRTRETD